VLGIVTASLIAAFMSTLSTHLNWGASYITHDFYQRFIKPEATEKELLWVGRISTLLLMVFAMLVALRLESALDGFQILLQIGAGTGLLFLLRWFWFKINAAAEIAAMAASFVVAVFFKWGLPTMDINLEASTQLMLGVAITTVCWVATAYLTPGTDPGVLENFQKKTSIKQINARKAIYKAVLGTILIYSVLFGTGLFLYGETLNAAGCLLAAILAGYVLQKLSKRQGILPEK
jgi:Na+/proline symporter